MPLDMFMIHILVDIAALLVWLFIVIEEVRDGHRWSMWVFIGMFIVGFEIANIVFGFHV